MWRFERFETETRLAKHRLNWFKVSEKLRFSQHYLGYLPYYFQVEVNESSWFHLRVPIVPVSRPDCNRIQTRGVFSHLYYHLVVLTDTTAHCRVIHELTTYIMVWINKDITEKTSWQNTLHKPHKQQILLRRSQCFSASKTESIQQLMIQQCDINLK